MKIRALKEVKTEWMVKVLMVLFTIHYSLFTSMAQVSVEASVDRIEMLVGQQAHVTLKAVVKENSKVEFPQFKASEFVTPGVEVLTGQPLDDKELDNGCVEKTMVYTLTSFDDTLYYLPPLTVKVDGKPYQSKSLALKVLTIEVDTTHVEQFFGPKDVQDNPFLWSDWSLSFWLSVLLLILLALVYYLYIRMRDNKPIITHIRIIKKLLPHQKAMKEIEQIKADKMVSSENPKEYYTKLTDTLRKYIEERYGFSAMEMTSSEIIDQLMKNADQESLAELRQLFLTADLVKFAKYSTLINENDANLVSAVDFINKTKIEQPVKPQYTQEEQETRKRRLVLKTTIAVIAVGCVGIFGAIAYYIYELL